MIGLQGMCVESADSCSVVELITTGGAGTTAVEPVARWREGLWLELSAVLPFPVLKDV